MAVSFKNIISPKQVESTQTVQYTAIGVKCIIDKFTVTNTSTSNVSISVNLIPLAGAASNSNLIVKTKTLVPSEVYLFPEIVGQIIEPNGVISTIASSASSLTLTASGREVS